MKIRQGFVSNSSTSSFILVGCSVVFNKNITVDFINEAEDIGLDYSNETMLVGRTVARVYDDGPVQGQESIEDLLVTVYEVKARVKALAKQFGEDVKFDEVKLHFGMESN